MSAMTHRTSPTGFFSALFLCLTLFAGSTLAQSIETPAREAFVFDLNTGAVLLEKNADELMPPASMSKLMTVTMVFERLKEGSLKLDDTLPVSEKAWKKGGSKMFVEVDTRVAVSDLLRGIIVQSGNDACIVVAEGLGGSEEGFAEAMTSRARELGLEKSTFRNATGWPDPNHKMTARELGLLAKHIIQDFPEYYPIFAEKDFTFSEIKQGNRNPLLYKNNGSDGLKTGHTEESGYGLVGSAERDGRRIVVVVNGLENAKARSRESERLMEWAFREFNNYALFKTGDIVDNARVWLGNEDTVPLTVESDLTVTLSRAERKSMTVKVVYNEPIPAPIIKGTPVAQLVVEGPEIETITVPLIATEDVTRPGAIKRLTSAVEYLVFGPSSN
ncbi:D-alanyl-D-alanine carboxypeptidase family protein [Sneathiella sp. HT1-7]|uniref:D-alanyl-D-alanine carboxypeptidase family protein n=1 Tax=Sneathiella sp. HT1-7 TaxID=2887192 RepID=UPI001D13F300|nr:D-alanyl-D-alanine carboxypeptidase family protein [Sneathiella sp. HT1-7]MCC3306052.1 D-alanyl-D-alanine carboxypeptidase [Sneathiella sp. HT1-7]